MAFDFKSLQKLQTRSASAAMKQLKSDELVEVLVKLHEGAEHPSYVTPRTHISSQIFSAEIPAGDLSRLEADDGVESVALSQPLPLIK